MCPFCGAPLRELVNGACPFCKTSLQSAAGTVPPIPNRPASGAVWLHDCGKNKIAVIKVLREALGLGLKEAKDLADAAGPGRPVDVAIGRSPDQAARLADELRRTGATVDAG